MTNITELKDPASLERLLDDLGTELEKHGEPSECIGYVSWAISEIYDHCKLGEVIQVQEFEVGGAIAIKGKVNTLLAELIRAHVWIWHCGGSEAYGFPGPGRTRPAPGAARPKSGRPFLAFRKLQKSDAEAET